MPRKFRPYLLLFFPLLILFTTACSVSQADIATTPPAGTGTPERYATSTDPVQQSSDLEATKSPVEEIIRTQTPEPTATPGVLTEIVSEIASQTGLNKSVFLGLTGEDWINLGISLLIVVIGYLVLTRLAYILLRQIARATNNQLAEHAVEAIKGQISWLSGVILIRYGTNRLLFLPSEWKQTLNQVFFAILVLAFSMILWKLIDLGLTSYEERSSETDARQSQLNIFLPLLRRVAIIVLFVSAAILILNNFGINVTLLLGALGIGGLALSLAAQDTLADMISGFIILVDQPFRIGDRIGIQDLDTWGDVVEIGTRTTRILTRDNRMVIVPNSKISKSQVVNYSYPDPRYRLQTEIGVEYGVDLDHVREVIIAAVREVEGVLPDMPVQALLHEMGETALRFRVRWWINSYIDLRAMTDKVHSAIYNAINQAGIEMPFPTFDVNLALKEDDLGKLMEPKPKDEEPSEED